MPKPIIFALAVSVAAAASAQAPAGGAAPAPQTAERSELVKKLDDSFNRVDVNNDGFLSRDEVASAGTKALQQAQENVEDRMDEEFKKLDTDKNNQLSLAEFKAAAKVRANVNPDQALQRLDSNKDGKISAAEYKSTALASFDKFDANKDGKVTPEEQKAPRQ